MMSLPCRQVVTASENLTCTTSKPLAISRLHADIFMSIFDQFDTTRAIDRTSCARCALVCRAWAEPASKALWRSLWGSLLPLYGILFPVPEIVRKSHIGSFHGSQVPPSYIEYIHKVSFTMHSSGNQLYRHP